MKGKMGKDMGGNRKVAKKMTAVLAAFVVGAMSMTGCGSGQEQTAKEKTAKEEKGSTNNTADSGQKTEKEEPEMAEVSFTRVSVHDPSVFYDNGTYYIFGSHMAWAKSPDLMNWESFTMNINSKYPELFGKEWESYCQTASNPNLGGNLWAPDVIYNKAMQKYCMYMSVNGDDWNSVIVMLTADNIEGPYEYGGPVVWSGFDDKGKHDVNITDVYEVLGDGADLSRYQSTKNTKLNCIDSCVKYDAEGNLWMAYGSWFGGLYMLKLDETTGLRDYETIYETVADESDAYYGYKIAGGHGVSGEGPYIIYKDGYYYVFVSYGGLVTSGGYQIRVFRSENIFGPYVDESGNSSVYTAETNNLFSKTGIRLMGTIDWSGNREMRAAQGHNSAYVTEEGQIFLVYHSRFAGGKNGIEEAHEVRVQQLFVNEDGWLIAAPYEYAGEVISETGYKMEEMCGDYEWVVHIPNTYYQKSNIGGIGIMTASQITLKEDGTVSGDLTGSWTHKEGTPQMTITIDGITYKGVFLKMPSEKLYFKQTQREMVMTFTVLGENVTAWGSK